MLSIHSVWGENVSFEVVLEITLSHFDFYTLSHSCILSQFGIFIPWCNPLVLGFPKTLNMLTFDEKVAREGEFCPLLGPCKFLGVENNRVKCSSS